MMMNGMAIFAIAIGGTALICCVLATQSKYRRGNRGSSPDSFGSDNAGVFSPGDGSHFGGSGGHHSVSGHSTSSGDSSSGDSAAGDSGGGDGGGGDGGGGGSD
jgi:hypothetical protein